MRPLERIEAWVVYQTIVGDRAGRRSMCKQSEWEALILRNPAMNVLVQAGIASEMEAELVARGTSGDVVPRKSKTDGKK
jgi:hypothetical protein